MAELKNMILTLVFTLFVATAMIAMYSVAVSNSVANGGSGVSDNALNASLTNYTNKLDTFQQVFANSTQSAAEAPATESPTAGIGSLATAGAAAVSVTWDSLGIMLGLISTSITTLAPLGVPAYVSGFGLVFVTLIMGFAILAAVFKWWL